MNLYLILAVAVVSRCASDQSVNQFYTARFTTTGAIYQSAPPPMPKPSCEASLDVSFTTDTAKAYAALEAGQRVFKVNLREHENPRTGEWDDVVKRTTELHRVASTEYRIIEEDMKP